MKFSKKTWHTLLWLVMIAALCGGMVAPMLPSAQAAPLLQAGTAELSLTMTVNNSTPNRADSVIFAITVSNAGPDVATGVTISDLLPAGLSYVSDSGGGTYNSSTGTWTVGAVPVGGGVALNIITNATTTGTKTNSAQIVASDQTDPNAGNNVASVSVTPRSSDVSITMSVNNSTPSIGDIIVITIVTTNTGPDNASGVRVTDVLPAGLLFISFTSSSTSGSGGTYTSSTGNWSVGTLSVGVTKTLNITASVTTSGTKTNYAEVTESDQLDPDSTPANVSTTEDDDASVVLNAPSADLALTLNVNTTTPNKTDNVILTITVTNAGSSNATGVTVRDALPAGLTYVSDDGAGTYNSTTGIWSVGSLLSSGVGSSDTLNITARATTTGTKVNIAEVWTSNQSDPDSTPGNGVSSEDDYSSVSITPRSADLSITKTADNSAPVPGNPVIFTITVSNGGPDGATGVTVLDALPAGYAYVSDDAGGAYNSATGVWTVGNLAASANRILRITATATANPNRTNSVEVRTSDQLDPDSTPGNNSNSEDDDDAAPKVDLSLTKTVNNAVPSQGTNIVFTLTVRNSGPGNASGITVRDILPAALVYVSDTGGGNYNSGTGMWNVGTLANGATSTLSITARANTIGVSTNSAEIWTADQFDIDSIPGDNSTTTDDDESVSVTVSYPSMSLLINEVAWAGTAASSSDEWIELYNPGSTPISLSGWILKAVDGTPTINLPNGFILQPGEFFLLERTDDTTVSDIAADLIYTGELANSSESLQLLDPLNRVVDTANSNGGNWPAGSTSIFGSMERRGVMTDSDTAWITNTGVVSWGRDAGIPNDCTTTNPPCLTAPRTLNGTPKRANWATTVTPTPSPIGGGGSTSPTSTPQPTLPPPPELVAINEFVPRPGRDWNNDGVINTGDEYIEILNHGTISVDLSGYTLDDEANVGSSPYTLPSVTLEPGERMVFYGSQTNLLLSDGGDGVRLLKPNGQLMDAYNYTVVRYPDQSFCRLPDNGGLDDWNQNCSPTPGLRNNPGSVLSGSLGEDGLCPIADTLPQEFYIAECDPFGRNIWNRPYWDDTGWLGEQDLPNIPGAFAD